LCVNWSFINSKHGGDAESPLVDEHITRPQIVAEGHEGTRVASAAGPVTCDEFRATTMSNEPMPGDLLTPSKVEPGPKVVLLLAPNIEEVLAYAHKRCSR